MSSLDHEARAANQFWFRKARHFILGNCDGSEYFPLLRCSARELEICNVSISSLRQRADEPRRFCVRFLPSRLKDE
jgi:hypothetical protein